MMLNQLTAISPIDGRYRKLTASFAPLFSEFGLIRYRVLTEIEYFIALCNLPLPQLAGFDKSKYPEIRKLFTEFSEEDALWIKNKEAVTNHDVKAVEYFLKDRFEQLGIGQHKEFIHFGLTSQDINNTATPALLKDAVHTIFLPYLSKVIESLTYQAEQYKNIPMLARTHGQPASPTKLGKELMVFVKRIERQLELLYQIPFSAKFGGATGNMNAHYITYPEIDWANFADNFVEKHLQLQRSFPTTQIEHYDNLAALFDTIKRINTILIDLSRDVWQYISMNYFKQKIEKDQVGSSAMPHKVNPIDFENAEGNLGIANAVFEHLSAKLPVSRLQRDLTDSTVLRNIGVPFAHSLIAFISIEKGLKKLELNEDAIHADLEANWAVVAEAIQTILRREGFDSPYELLKNLTRKNEKITQRTFHEFIDELEVDEALKSELKAITPFNYTGL